MEFNFRTRIFVIISMVIFLFHQLENDFFYLRNNHISISEEFYVQTFPQKYELYMGGDALEQYIRGKWVLVSGSLDDEILLTRKDRVIKNWKTHKTFNFMRRHKVYLKSVKKFLKKR